MKNELTDVYSIMQKEFKDHVEHFRISNNKELAAFLHYNAHNEMFTDTKDSYYHEANFKNLDTGKESRMFSEGSIYFFPKDDIITQDNDMTAFSIEKKTKCVKVNANGLFVEKNDLNGNITTEYYDVAALNEICKQGLSAGNIDYIENYIQGMGISPDRIISTKEDDNNLVISIIENGEVIKKGQIPVDENRTYYSTYYEFMKSMNYYGIAPQINNPDMQR